MSKGKVRTKGNVKPSSSARAAQLFDSGTSIITFDALRSDADEELSPDVRAAFRQLWKRDSVTKLKALSLLQAEADSSVDTTLIMVPSWARSYSRMSTDSDFRVRLASHQLTGTIVPKGGKKLTPQNAKSIIPYWLLGTFDANATVARGVTALFDEVFPGPEKQAKVFELCKKEILDSCLSCITVTPDKDKPSTSKASPSAGPGSDSDCDETFEARWERLATSALMLLARTVSVLSGERELVGSTTVLPTLVGDEKLFKKIVNSKNAMVKSAFLTFVSAQINSNTHDGFGPNSAKVFSACVVNNLDSAHPALCRAAWEAFLGFLKGNSKDGEEPPCFSWGQLDSAILPKICAVARRGLPVAACVVGPALLPVLAALRRPSASADGSEQQQRMMRVVEAVFLGLIGNLEGKKDATEIAKAYFDCCLYVSIQHPEECETLKKQVHQILLSTLPKAEVRPTLSTYCSFLARLHQRNPDSPFLKDLQNSTLTTLGTTLQFATYPPGLVPNVAYVLEQCGGSGSGCRLREWTLGTLTPHVVGQLDGVWAKAKVQGLELLSSLLESQLLPHNHDSIRHGRTICLSGLTDGSIQPRVGIDFLLIATPRGDWLRVLEDVKSTNSLPACLHLANTLLGARAPVSIGNGEDSIAFEKTFLNFVRDLVAMALDDRSSASGSGSGSGSSAVVGVEDVIQLIKHCFGDMPTPNQKHLSNELLELLAKKLTCPNTTSEDYAQVVPFLCQLADTLLEHVTVVAGKGDGGDGLKPILANLHDSLVRLSLSGFKHALPPWKRCAAHVKDTSGVSAVVKAVRPVFWEVGRERGYVDVKPHVPAFLISFKEIGMPLDDLLPTLSEWEASEPKPTYPCMLLTAAGTSCQRLTWPPSGKTPVLAAEIDFWNNVQLTMAILTCGECKPSDPVTQGYLWLAYVYAKGMWSYAKRTLQQNEAVVYETQMLSIFVFIDCGSCLVLEQVARWIREDRMLSGSGECQWVFALRRIIEERELWETKKDEQFDRKGRWKNEMLELWKEVVAGTSTPAQRDVLEASSNILDLDDLDLTHAVNMVRAKFQRGERAGEETPSTTTTPLLPTLIETQLNPLLTLAGATGTRHPDPQEVEEVLTLVLEMKDGLEDWMVFGRPVSAESEVKLNFNTRLVSLLTILTDRVAELEGDLRDFLFCSLIAWYQSFSEDGASCCYHLLRPAELSLLLSLNKLFTRLATAIKELANNTSSNPAASKELANSTSSNPAASKELANSTSSNPAAMKELANNTSMKELANSTSSNPAAMKELANDTSMKELANSTSSIPAAALDVRAEWDEFFLKGISGLLLDNWMRFVDESAPDNFGYAHLAVSFEAALRHIDPDAVQEVNPKETILAPELDGLGYPPQLQSILLTLTSHLKTPLPVVQLTAYRLLEGLTVNIVSVTEGQRKKSAEGSIDTESIPASLMADLGSTDPSLLPSFYSSLIESTSQTLTQAMTEEEHLLTLDPATPLFTDVLAYLLTWRLVLGYVKSLHPATRPSVAEHLKETKLLERLLLALLCLMPERFTALAPPDQLHGLLRRMPSGDVVVNPTGATVEWTATHVFFEALRTLPGVIRQWWNNQNRSLTSMVERRTTGLISDQLSADELAYVISKQSDDNVENLKLTVRPSTREVLATYTYASEDDMTMELVLQLPSNYPLGIVSIESVRRVGVPKEQWRKWMLQLSVFLMHQNGSVYDGLIQWRRNIDKHMDGVEECTICMMTVHSANYQLPKIACKQCKKKFHSACLYKWFNTSNTANCPLCRTEF